MNREIITEVKLQQEKGVASVRSKRADAKGMQKVTSGAKRKRSNDKGKEPTGR